MDMDIGELILLWYPQAAKISQTNREQQVIAMMRSIGGGR